MAHVGHHFVDLVKTDKSTTVAAPDSFIDQFYGIKREVKGMAPEQRLQEPRRQALPMTHAQHARLIAQHTKVV